MAVEVQVGSVKFTVDNILFIFRQPLDIELTSLDTTNIQTFNLAIYNLIFSTQKANVLNVVGIYDYVTSDRHDCFKTQYVTYYSLTGQ